MSQTIRVVVHGARSGPRLEVDLMIARATCQWQVHRAGAPRKNEEITCGLNLVLVLSEAVLVLAIEFSSATGWQLYLAVILLNTLFDLADLTADDTEVVPPGISTSNTQRPRRINLQK